MSTLERYALVALGGAVGAAARYFASARFGSTAATTFWVNMSGSLLIGLLIGSAAGADARLRLLVGSGLLGGYTTFSTLQLEALLAVRQGDWWHGAANLVGSIASGFVAVAFGYGFGRMLR
jgi:CrcB protein